jgi:hypothetical protein
VLIPPSQLSQLLQPGLGTASPRNASDLCEGDFSSINPEGLDSYLVRGLFIRQTITMCVPHGERSGGNVDHLGIILSPALNGACGNP